MVCFYDVFVLGISDILVGLAFLAAHFGNSRWKTRERCVSFMAGFDIRVSRQSLDWYDNKRR